MCHCGKPIHYTDLENRVRVKRLIHYHGEFVSITIEGKGTFKVQRHYIALHGIKADEIDQLGFEKVEES